MEKENASRFKRGAIMLLMVALGFATVAIIGLCSDNSTLFERFKNTFKVQTAWFITRLLLLSIGTLILRHTPSLIKKTHKHIHAK